MKFSNHTEEIISPRLKSKITGCFTKDLNASFCLALHVASNQPSHILEILNWCGTLHAFYPRTGAHLCPGQIFLAPPGQPLLIEGEQVMVTHQALLFRLDDIDRLFLSAALSYGNRLIGVLLTGRLYDGTRGMQAIKQHGGYLDSLRS